MCANTKLLGFAPRFGIFICYPCVFTVFTGPKHTDFWERFSMTHRNFAVHLKLIVSSKVISIFFWTNK